MAFYAERGFFAESKWKVEFEGLVSQKSKVKNQKSTDTRKYLFVAGSLVEHKGVRQLLEAWNPSELVTRYSSPVTLTIVGDGPLRPLVEAAAEKDSTINYLGRVPHEELDAIYASHDVLVFSSQCIENRPNVLVEAMAYGLEIIAVRTGGVEEMVKEYDQIELIDPEETFTIKKPRNSARV
jgi:glycosyltransferase involved in cell wall biosynthesis